MPSGRVFAGKKVEVTGTFAVTGGSVTQYVESTTAGANTYTGMVVLGVNDTTATAVKVASDGTVFVSGGGGGVQYVQNTTAGNGTHTGTVIMGIQSTTARAVQLSATGGISYVDTISFVAAGTVDAVVTGTVTALPNGTQNVIIIGTPSVTAADVTIASIATGTVNVATGLINISGTVPVTMASLATVSTVLTLPTITVGTASNVLTVGTLLGTIAISGSMSVINAPTVTIGGTASAALVAGTTRAGSVFMTAHQSAWQAAVIATTSAATGVIVMTSGAHTLYVTDLLVNVAGPMTVTLCSETTALMYLVGLATNGGFAMNNITPIVCTTAQSLRVVPGSSGSCSVFAAGYTVT